MARPEMPPMPECTSCGDCCGPVSARPKEIKRIRELLRESGEGWRSNGTLTCGFYRAEEGGRCAVYDARPFGCRAFGVIKEMPCPHFPQAARLSLPADEAVLRWAFAKPTKDKLLGEVFEGRGYLLRLGEAKES